VISEEVSFMYGRYEVQIKDFSKCTYLKLVKIYSLDVDITGTILTLFAKEHPSL
jgi:hypothetical protein